MKILTRKQIRWFRQQKRVFLIMLAFLGIALVVQYMTEGWPFNKAVTDSQTAVREFDEEQTGLEQLLRGNTSHLIDASLDLLDNKQKPFTVRLDNMEKRLAISDRILELDHDDHSREFALSTKLTALMDRELLYQENEIVDESNNYQLKELAERQLTDPSIANLAISAETVAILSQFLSEDSVSERALLAEKTIDGVRRAAGNSINNFNNADRLLDWIRLIEQRFDQNEARQFFDAFISSYSKSTDKNIVALLKQIHLSADGRSMELVDILNSIPTEVEAAIEKFLDQVDDAMSRTETTDTDINLILKRCEDLLAIGKIEAAKKAADKTRQLSIRDSSNKLKERLAILDRRIEMMGKSLDLSCFSNHDALPVKFHVATAKYKVLFFVSTRLDQEYSGEFRNLFAAIRPLVADASLEFIVVCLDDGDDPENLKDSKNFAAASVHWQVWFLQTNSDNGRKFLHTNPIVETPYSILLDVNDQVISLGPSPDIIEEIAYKK